MDTSPILVPIRQNSNISCGFQSRNGQSYLQFGRGVDLHVIHSLGFTSGATPADLTSGCPAQSAR